MKIQLQIVFTFFFVHSKYLRKYRQYTDNFYMQLRVENNKTNNFFSMYGNDKRINLQQ